MSKIYTPNSLIIEKIAAEFATIFYEVGRSQGLQSKHKNAKSYAKDNLEKFTPLAIKHLISMLSPTSNCSPEMREEIYDCLISRANDPSNITLPDINIKKILANMPKPIPQLMTKVREKPINVLNSSTALSVETNPFRAKRH